MWHDVVRVPWWYEHLDLQEVWAHIEVLEETPAPIAYNEEAQMRASI